MEDYNKISQTQQPVNPTPAIVNSGKSKVILIILGVAAAIVIAIGAYVLGSKQSQPVVQNTVQTTPIPSPSVAIDETANWKTYTNNKYGYSFKYPSLLVVEDAFNPVFIKSNDLVFMEILSESAEVGNISFNEIYNAPNGQIKSYPSYYDVEYLSTVKTYTQTKISNFEVNGKMAVRWESKRIIEKPPRTILTAGVSILTEKYHFSVWTDNENQENPKSIELFDQILSTFKFTP